MTPSTPSPSRSALVGAFATIYVVWGSTYLAIRVGVETIPPFLLAGTRFLAAGLPLYLVLRWRGAPRPAARHWLSAAITGALMMAGGNGLVTWSEQSVPSGVAALIIATVPLWMTLLEVWPFRRARLTARAVVGLACGLVGVLVLVAPGGREFRTVDPWGGAALLLSALLWSTGSLLSRSLRLPASPFQTAAMQMIAGGAVLASVSALAGEWRGFDPSTVELRSVIALGYLVLFGSILALCAYAWLIRATSAAAVSTYAFVNPVVAVTLGWLFAGEAIGPRVGLAALAIVGAVVFLQGARWLDARQTGTCTKTGFRGHPSRRRVRTGTA